MTINEWAKEIHELAVSKGWWEGERNFGEMIALCHSELSEALEHYRHGSDAAFVKTKVSEDGKSLVKKPDGWQIELIDCVIRILDMLGYYNANVEKLLELKHEFNKTRPYRHGGKKA